MKDLISRINKSFENRIRLGIMSMLMVHELLDFNTLKEMLEVTDGNLSSHASSLEAEGFIRIEKSFSGKKPMTQYKATEAGKKAFRDHIEALEALLKASSKPKRK